MYYSEARTGVQHSLLTRQAQMQAWSSIKEQAHRVLEEAYAMVSEAEAAEEEAAQLQGQADAATKWAQAVEAVCKS